MTVFRLAPAPAYALIDVGPAQVSPARIRAAQVFGAPEQGRRSTLAEKVSSTRLASLNIDGAESVREVMRFISAASGIDILVEQQAEDAVLGAGLEFNLERDRPITVQNELISLADEDRQHADLHYARLALLHKKANRMDLMAGALDIQESELRRFARLAAPLLQGAAARGLGSRAARNRAGPGLEFLDMRDYQPGDDQQDYLHRRRNVGVIPPLCHI